MIASGVLGVITLIAVVHTFRTASRGGARITCASRILSMLTALPAFFVPGVPALLVVLAAVTVVLTLISVFLVLARPGDAGLIRPPGEMPVTHLGGVRPIRPASRPDSRGTDIWRPSRPSDTRLSRRAGRRTIVG